MLLLVFDAIVAAASFFLSHNRNTSFASLGCRRVGSMAMKLSLERIQLCVKRERLTSWLCAFDAGRLCCTALVAGLNECTLPDDL